MLKGQHLDRLITSKPTAPKVLAGHLRSILLLPRNLREEPGNQLDPTRLLLAFHMPDGERERLDALRYESAALSILDIAE